MAGYANTATFDHLQITKKFERGAAFSTTEESVFAMLGITLDSMRSQSQAFIDQSNDIQNITSTSPTQKKTMDTAAGGDGAEYIPEKPDVGNLKDKDEEDPNWLERISGNFTTGGDLEDGATFTQADIAIPGFLDSNCIPCGFRIQFLGQLNLKADLKGFGLQFLEMWKQAFNKMLEQIQQIINMFSNLDKFVDLCAFFKFINDFVCIPDLQAMLSALMALLAKVGFEFGGILDLTLGLIAPLFAPFLSGLVTMLNRYVLMVIEPLECIIDAIQRMLSKLDYNVLFKNIQSLDRQFNFDPPAGLQSLFGAQVNERPDPRPPIETPPALQWIPFVDAHVERADIQEADPIYTKDFNLLWPVSNAIERDNAEKQEAIEKATDELAAVRKAGRKINGVDQEAIAAYRERERQAKENLQNAQDAKDLSEIGRANKKIDETVANFKSMLFKMVAYVREAIESINAFLRELFDELKKILSEYLGGSGSLVFELFKKLEILQIVGFIGALIAALSNNRNCDPEDAGAIKLEDVIGDVNAGLQAWTDQDGRIHIQRNDDEINNAIDSLVGILGRLPQPNPDLPSSLGSPANAGNLGPGDSSGLAGAGPNSGIGPQGIQGDLGISPSDPNRPISTGIGPKGSFGRGGKGQSSTDNVARQRLKGLIQLTGDDVLDAQIARTTEAFTTSTNVTFDCPLQTSVAQTEQINKWIRELNSE